MKKFYDELIIFLEKEFPDKTAKSLTAKNMVLIDEFVRAKTSSKMSVAEQSIVRAFVVGHIIEERQGRRTVIIKPKEIYLSKLPTIVTDAMKEYKLSEREAYALNVTINHTAKHLTDATDSTISKVRNVMFKHIIKRGRQRELEWQLREEFIDDSKELNRNWNSVAATEISYAFNNGYLATLRQGDWVIGISNKCRCKYCEEMISGKIYYFLETTDEMIRYDNLHPQNKEYAKRDWIWSNCIWLYKDNYGRRRTKHKLGGEGLVDREAHEMFKPTIPLHVQCSCSWSKFIPESMYVTKDGKVNMSAMNVKEWEIFNETKIKPIKEKLIEYGIIKIVG